MLAEKIIFNTLAFALFIIMFFKMMRKDDTTYIPILVAQALGIFINFIEMIMNTTYPAIMKCILYVLSIILPIAILILEYKGINFTEIIHITIANILLKLGNTKSAKNILIKLTEKNSKSYQAHCLLAEIYEKEGGMRKAVDEYVKAIDINKRDYDSYYKIAYLLTQLDKKEEATSMLENLINKKPDYIAATILLGDLLCENQKYKEALNVYMDALKFAPNSFDLYYNMGIAYTMLNDFANAKSSYERAAIINTLSYNSFYNIAQINLIFGDLEEAQKCFQRALMDEDIEPKAYYYMAKIYMLQGDRDNAIKFVNMAIETDHNYSQMADEESIFIPIKAYINFVIIDEEDKEERKLKMTEKEKLAQEHLEDTYDMVGKLGNNEIKKQMKLQEKQPEIEQDGIERFRE